ncbi:hypothetical protein CISIN_1g048015mg, partial [Citrus sinensis]
RNTKKATTEFLEPPLEQKNKHAVPSDDIQGYGHAYVVSEQQILDSSDALILFVCPAEYRKLNFWPNTPKGLSPRSDTSTITILTQEDDASGLQIKHNRGWVPVNPVTDALVILSNGKFKSIEHRAVKRPLSMYKKIKYGDYLRNSSKRRMERKAHTEMVKAQA